MSNLSKFKIVTFDPRNKYRFLWDLFIVFAILYVSIFIPLHLTFKFELSPFEKMLDSFILFVFVLDLVINFNTGVFVNGEYSKNHKVIATKYLKTWFTIDLIAAIPFAAVLSLFIDLSENLSIILKLHILVKMFRFLRLTRISRYFQKLLGIDFLDPGYLKLFYFMIGVTLFTHLVSCGWMLLSISTEYVAPFPKYVKASYWAIATLTTVGYGDQVPTTVSQMIYTNFVMYMGVGLYAYIIGNIASTLANLNLAKVQYRNKIQSVNAFLKYKKVPKSLQKRINEYYEFVWDKQLIQSESVLLHELPLSFQRELKLILKREFIRKVPIFKNAEKSCIEDLAFCFTTHIFAPDDFVFKAGDDDSTGLFFINSGIIEVITEPEKRVVASLHEGNFFGETALLFNQERSASIRCKTFCELLQLSKSDFHRVLQNYPKFAKHLNKISKERTQKNR